MAGGGGVIENSGMPPGELLNFRVSIQNNKEFNKDLSPSLPLLLKLKIFLRPPPPPSGGRNDDFRPLTYNPWGEGHGGQGKICDILRPQLAMNLFLPQIPILWIHKSGGRGREGL
jgi:hypothetical protein